MRFRTTRRFPDRRSRRSRRFSSMRSTRFRRHSSRFPVRLRSRRRRRLPRRLILIVIQRLSLPNNRLHDGTASRNDRLRRPADLNRRRIVNNRLLDDRFLLMHNRLPVDFRRRVVANDGPPYDDAASRFRRRRRRGRRTFRLRRSFPHHDRFPFDDGMPYDRMRRRFRHRRAGLLSNFPRFRQLTGMLDSFDDVRHRFAGDDFLSFRDDRLRAAARQRASRHFGVLVARRRGERVAIFRRQRRLLFRSRAHRVNADVLVRLAKHRAELEVRATGSWNKYFNQKKIVYI